MTDETVVVESIPRETQEEMQNTADKLVEMMKLLLPPQGDSGADQYDALCQHTIVGNALIRILIGISEKVGPLDMGAVRNGAFQALAYVNSIAQPITDPKPGEEPSVN